MNISNTSQQQHMNNSPGSQQAGRDIVNNPPIDIDSLAKKLEERLGEQFRNGNEKLREEMRNDLAKKRTYNPLASDALAQLNIGNFELAKKLYRTELAERKEQGKSAMRDAAAAARHLGAIAYLSNNDEALGAYREAVNLDPENLDGLNQLANVLLRKGNQTQAEAVLLKLRELAKDQNNIEVQAWAANNLGNIYLHNKNARGADEMFRQALKLNESIKRKKGIALNYNGLANFYMATGNPMKAWEMAKEAFLINKEILYDEKDAPDGFAIADNLNTLGNAHFQLRDYPAAEQKFCEARRVHQSLKNEEGVAKGLYFLGKVYEVRGNGSVALTLYRTSLKHFSGLALAPQYKDVEEAVTRLASTSSSKANTEVEVCGVPISALN